MEAAPETVALHRAIWQQDYDKVVQILGQEDVKPDAPHGMVSTLAAATEVGNAKICAALLQSGADVNFRGRSWRFPLYIAAHSGNLEILSLLLEHSADINMRHATGNSPLLEAVAQGHGPIVPYLLNAGADPLVRNNAGETGLHLAAIQGNLDHVKLFLEAGVNVNAPRVSPLKRCHADNSGSSQNPPKKATEVSGFTPLHLAIYADSSKHCDVVEFLISHDAMINAQLPNGRTPLHLAAMRKAEEIAALLLSNGCEVDPVSMENGEHKTPLMKAVDAGHLTMVEMLINAGADVNFRDHWGCSPMLSAIFNGKVKVVHALLRAGCDVDLPSNGGFTPFKASLRHPPYMTQMLVLAGCHLGPEISILLDSSEDNKLYDAHQDVRDWILNLVNNPKSLQQTCREKIRSQLSTMIHRKVYDLQVPQTLKDYIDLCDATDIQNLCQEVDTTSMVIVE